MVENDQNVVASPIEFLSGIKHCAPINAREPLNAPRINTYVWSYELYQIGGGYRNG